MKVMSLRKLLFIANLTLLLLKLVVSLPQTITVGAILTNTLPVSTVHEGTPTTKYITAAGSSITAGIYYPYKYIYNFYSGTELEPTTCTFSRTIQDQLVYNFNETGTVNQQIGKTTVFSFNPEMLVTCGVKVLIGYYTLGSAEGSQIKSFVAQMTENPSVMEYTSVLDRFRYHDIRTDTVSERHAYSVFYNLLFGFPDDIAYILLQNLKFCFYRGLEVGEYYKAIGLSEMEYTSIYSDLIDFIRFGNSTHYLDISKLDNDTLSVNIEPLDPNDNHLIVPTHISLTHSGNYAFDLQC